MRGLVSKLLAVSLVILLAGSAFAAPKFTLKFNHVLAPTEPYHEGFTNWAKAVEEKTKGDLKIEVYHSAQLGVEEDILEQIRAGANIGQNTDSARMGMYVPDIAVMNAPYFINYFGAKTPEEVMDVLTKIRQAPTMQAWLKDLEEKFGFKVVSFKWVQGYRHFFTNKPIRKPEDLKGLRIRTPGTPIWQESVRALGAQPVAIKFGEIYTAIQTKAVDGAELVYANIVGGKLYEVLKHASETGHILLINFEVVSSKWFNTLPPEYQKVMVDECDKAGVETSYKIMKELNEKFKQEVISKGVQVITDPDIPAFMKAGEEAYKVLKLLDARDKLLKEVKGK